MGPLRTEALLGFLPPSPGSGGDLCRNKTSILGEGPGLTRSACVNASPPGSGLPSHQLMRPAERHVRVGLNFLFLPLKMKRRGKENQRETN